MSSLEFPQSARDAAREQLARWHIAPGMDIDDLQCELAGRFEEIKRKGLQYGVETAIRSGTRMRWLDQAGGSFEAAQLNCAETGINVFLLLSEAGLEERLRMLAFTVGATSHLSVLCGDDRGYAVFDPWFGCFNRARLLGNAVVYEYGFEIDLGSSARERERRDIQKGGWALLSKDEVLRHVNRMNSPLGFFDYYADGQKIGEKERGIQRADICVQTAEDLLILSVTASDESVDAYTFQRAYSCFGGTLRSADTHLLHTGLSWVTPTGVLYREFEGVPQLQRPKEKTAAMIAFVDLVQRSTFAHNREEVVEEALGYRQALENAIENMHAQAVAEKQDSGAIVLFSECERKVEEFELSRKYYHEKLFPYIDGMPPEIRREYLTQLHHQDAFRHRQIRPFRPYARFAKEDEEALVQTLQRYCAARKELFRPIVDEHLGSETHRALLQQYRDAYALRQQIDLLAR